MSCGVVMDEKKQPPSGGCVLKLKLVGSNSPASVQPPSGGCVLKRKQDGRGRGARGQPPSGGCVLKQIKLFEHGGRQPSRLQAAVC